MISPFVKPYDLFNKRISIPDVPSASSSTPLPSSTTLSSSTPDYSNLYEPILSTTLLILKREHVDDDQDDEDEDRDYTETTDIEDETIIWTLQTIETLLDTPEIVKLSCWKSYQKSLINFLSQNISSPIEYENETEIICEEICLLHKIYDKGDITGIFINLFNRR